jgi:hypothetical protein
MFKLLTPTHWATQAATLTLAVFMGALALPCAGEQVGAQFTVAVKFVPASEHLPPGLPISAFCVKNNIPSAHGAVLTVVCSTGAVVEIESGNDSRHHAYMHGGAYRYVTHVTPTGALLETVDAFSGSGTTTAWRVVHLSDRDYFEMTLGW